jgi:hypothetical protein
MIATSRRGLVGAALALALTTPAVAQSGAMWVDDLGRMMEVGFGGVSLVANPVATDRSPVEMAALFKRVCLDTSGDPVMLPPDAADAAMLEATPFDIPANKKMPSIRLNMWRGKGVVLSQATGFFAAPNAQCNAVFYLPALPERDAIVAAMTGIVGSAPVNGDKAMKNGKPVRYYVPEWRVTFGDSPWIVVAHVSAANQSLPGNRVLLAVRSEKKAVK